MKTKTVYVKASNLQKEMDTPEWKWRFGKKKWTFELVEGRRVVGRVEFKGMAK